jgi:tRNA-2-methylthio-N6-dimethylallyladenosine synthase
MRRRYTRAQYLQLIDDARRVLPDLAVTTDLLVGFPGETDEDYRQTVAIMEAVRFDSAFMFAYSPRQRTYADRFLSDDVAAEVKQARLSEMIRLQESHSLQRFSALIGTTREVLVEGPAKASTALLFGRGDDNRATVFTPLASSLPTAGALVTVEITGASSHTLSGRQVH